MAPAPEERKLFAYIYFRPNDTSDSSKLKVNSTKLLAFALIQSPSSLSNQQIRLTVAKSNS